MRSNNYRMCRPFSGMLTSGAIAAQCLIRLEALLEATLARTDRRTPKKGGGL